MDLEYCKDTKENKPQHEVRTVSAKTDFQAMMFSIVLVQGTETFMATEVAVMKYHRLSELRLIASRTVSMKAPMERPAKADANPSLSKTSLPSFRHNALHDMEPIWWLCTWIIFYFIYLNEDALAWQGQYRTVFRSPATKQRFLLEPDRFNEFVRHLSNLPEAQILVACLQNWLMVLDNIYSITYAQQDEAHSFSVIEIDPEAINKAYDLGRRHLLTLQELSEKLTFEFAPLPRLLEAARREAEAPAAENSFEPKAGGSSVTNSSRRIMPSPKKRRNSEDE